MTQKDKNTKISVPPFTLDRQNKQLKPQMASVISDIIDSGMFILGENVKKLESEIAAYCGARHAVGVASGSDALYLALLACGVGPGDEVITTPFTFFATAGAIERTGARPVFTDIEPGTWNMDPAKAEQAVTPKTKAIIPVHLYGCPADMDSLKKIVANNNNRNNNNTIQIIEDAAQALGASYRNRPVGSSGDAVCFSFFPTKNLGAFGDAGMIVTDNPDIAEKASILRVHGSKPKYYHSILGCNSRLDELQAAILRVKHPHLDEWVKRRRAIAALYNQNLAGINDTIGTPQEPGYAYHCYHQYTIRVGAGRRDALQQHLKENGVGTAIYYPLCLHQQKVFAPLGYKQGDFPESEKASEEALSLPMFPELTDDEVTYVTDAIKSFPGLPR